MNDDERLMPRWGLGFAAWLAAMACALLFRVCSAEAQARPDLPDLASVSAPCPGEVLTLPVDGATGQWFPRDSAICVLGRLEALPRAVRYAQLLEDRLSLSDARDALLRRAKDLAVEESAEARGALEAAVRRAREAEEALGAWYRAPLLWFVVGVVVAGAVVALTAYGLSAAGS